MSETATSKTTVSLDTISMPTDAKPTLGEFNLRALSPFQRALLVIDGTVTKFIEAYTLEPVIIHRLSQQSGVLPAGDTALAAEADSRVLVRNVTITGSHTRTLYVYAVSMVVVERIPEMMRSRLAVQGAGIGRLLNELGMETRREMLWYARERAAIGPAWGGEPERMFFTRAYRIIHDGAPIALVHEKFPTELEGLPTHH